MSVSGTNHTITETNEVTAASSIVDDVVSTRTITTVADLQTEYVVGGMIQWLGGILRVQPWNFDDLTSNFGPMVYERMLWDPHIKAAHEIWKKSILMQGVKLTPAVTDPDGAERDKAEEIRDECHRQLQNIVSNFDSVLLDMLDAGAFGNKVAELVWDYEEVGKDKTPRTVLKDIKVKSLRTVAFVTDRYLNVLGILAINPGTGAPALVGTILSDATTETLRNDRGEKIPTTGTQLPPGRMIPREKFMILTHQPKDADPRGTSHLRAAYTPWWGKMQLLPEYMKFLAQYGTPSLVGYTAPGASSVPVKNADGTFTSVTAQQNLQNALVSFRNASVIALPAGSKVELLMGHLNPKSFSEDFGFFNSEMTFAILYQELTTGSGSHDSRAAAQVHQDIFNTNIQQGKNPVEWMIRKDVLEKMVIYNWGEDARHLTPVVSLGKVAFTDQAQMVASAGQAGYEFSPSQFAGLDEMFGFPARSVEDIKMLIERAKTIAVGVLPTHATPQQQALSPGNVPASPAASGGTSGNTNRDNRAKTGVTRGKG